MFEVFIQKSEDIILPLIDASVDEVVSIVRCLPYGRINLQEIRLVEAVELVGQCATGCSAVVVGSLNKHDRCFCVVDRSEKAFPQFGRAFPGAGASSERDRSAKSVVALRGQQG